MSKQITKEKLRIQALQEYIQGEEESYWVDGSKKSAYVEGLKHALHIVSGKPVHTIKWDM